METPNNINLCLHYAGYQNDFCDYRMKGVRMIKHNFCDCSMKAVRMIQRTVLGLHYAGCQSDLIGCFRLTR